MQRVTVVRRDQATALFVTVAQTLMVDIQDEAQDSFPVITESYLVPNQAYTPHNIYTLVAPVPDIRVGDGILDLSDIDPETLLPCTYDVAFVTRWRPSHLELSARKAAHAADVAALNMRTLLAYQQSVQWLRRITQATPGATATATRDPIRSQNTVGGGPLGGGWTATDPATGASRTDYFSAQAALIGINDVPQTSQMIDPGYTVYEKPLAYCVPPVVLAKGDILIKGAGQRYVVEDVVTPEQLYGTTVMQVCTLELRAPDNAIYAQPL